MCKISSLSIAIIFVVTAGSASAYECGKGEGFNQCILDAVSLLHETREAGGYSDNSFTRDLDYGPHSRVIKASKPTSTMCVAAVAEVIITALNIYHNNTGDIKPFGDLPYESWNDYSSLSIRDYIWENRGSHSAGYAFRKFGIGEAKKFIELEPGDFLSFDRVSGTGHSAIFIGYINKEFSIEDRYGSNVVGFKYYSSQGTGVPGLAYRYAFFAGEKGGNFCEKAPKIHNGIFVDCFGGGVSWRYTAERGGRVWSPAKWDVSAHVSQLKKDLVASIEPAIRTQVFNQVQGTVSLIMNGSINVKNDKILPRGDAISSVINDFTKKGMRSTLRKSPTAIPEYIDRTVDKMVSKAVEDEITKIRPANLDEKFLRQD